MIKRIKNLISVKNLTASQFADLLGVQRSNISHILSGRNKPSLDFVLKINEHFPSISLEWLLNGKGEMFVRDDKSSESGSLQLKIEEIDTDSAVDIDQLFRSELDKKNKEEDEVEIMPKKPIDEAKNPNNDNENIQSTEFSKKEEGIEKIMVLYKNGSFKVYNPQK